MCPNALAAGYRSLDTAAAYQNEEAVGRAIAASGIPRDELFRDHQAVDSGRRRGQGPPGVRRVAGAARAGYVDLYVIHQPLGDYYRSWREMEELNREGLAKAIGVSNFYADRLVDLIQHNEITPAVRSRPIRSTSAPPTRRSCASTACRSSPGAPFAEGQNNIFTDPVLSEIGEAHGKSVAQVILRWLIQRDVIVIPKSVRSERMRENVDVFDFALDDEQVARIAAMDTGRTQFFDHADPEWVSRLNSVRVD